MDPKDPLDQIFAYRVFDFRNRFPDPLPTFRAALERLQSGDAYLGGIDANLVAYLHDRRSITVPKCLYTVARRRFVSQEDAQHWVEERLEIVARGGPLARIAGVLIANPEDPIEKRIHDASESTVNQIVAEELNDTVCRQVDDWLRASIAALPKTD